MNIRRCIQKSQDNAHNTQVACSSRVSHYGVLWWCLVSECAKWRGWMWKHLIVAKLKLSGLSPRANYTDRAAAAGRRS